MKQKKLAQSEYVIHGVKLLVSIYLQFHF